MSASTLGSPGTELRDSASEEYLHRDLSLRSEAGERVRFVPGTPVRSRGGEPKYPGPPRLVKLGVEVDGVIPNGRLHELLELDSSSTRFGKLRFRISELPENTTSLRR